MEGNVLTAKVDTLVNASGRTEGLIVKWMTVSNVIFTPYVFRELANAEWVSEVMVLNAKRLNVAIIAALMQRA